MYSKIHSSSTNMTQSEVHIWLLDARQTFPQDRYLQILSIEEKQKLERFYFVEDQTHYLFYHGAMRQIISRYLNIPPYHLHIDTETDGKPLIVNPVQDRLIQFNLTHSGTYGMLALSHRCVGIDLEKIDPQLPHERMINHFMSKQEQLAFFRLPSEQRSDGFTRSWTRKEAYVKAIGKGLFYPIQQVTISLEEERPTLYQDLVQPQATSQWHIHNLSCPAGYKASLVIEAGETEISYYSFPTHS